MDSPTTKQPDKTAEVMRYLIERLGARGSTLGRTKLAKMLYLVDLEARRYMGRPITGMKWVRDNYGPFDLAGFVSAKNLLIEQGLIREDIVQFPIGLGYRYEPVGLHPDTLTPAEEAIVAFVLKEYGAMPRAELVEDVVYETKPFLLVKDQHGAALPMECVDNEARREFGGLDLEDVLEGEAELRRGEYVTLEDLFRDLSASDLATGREGH